METDPDYGDRVRSFIGRLFTVMIFAGAAILILSLLLASD